MAALDTLGGNDASAAILRGAVAAHFWAWYVAHQDDEIASLRVIFFSVRVRVSTVRPLFERLFGSPGHAGVIVS